MGEVLRGKAERELLERQFQELLEGGRAWQYAAYTLAATVVRMERDAGVDDPYKLLEDWAKRWQEEGDDLESWVAALIREMLDNGIKKPMRLKAV